MTRPWSIDYTDITVLNFHTNTINQMKIYLLLTAQAPLQLVIVVVLSEPNVKKVDLNQRLGQAYTQ